MTTAIAYAVRIVRTVKDDEGNDVEVECYLAPPARRGATSDLAHAWLFLDAGTAGVAARARPSARIVPIVALEPGEVSL
jgi:hypothetical protein